MEKDLPDQHTSCPLGILVTFAQLQDGFTTTVAGYPLGACLSRASQARERDANNIDRSQKEKRSYNKFFTQLEETGSSH